MEVKKKCLEAGTVPWLDSWDHLFLRHCCSGTMWHCRAGAPCRRGCWCWTLMSNWLVRPLDFQTTGPQLGGKYTKSRFVTKVLFMGQADSAVGRALGLRTADLGSILGGPIWSTEPARSPPEHRTRSKPWTSWGVAPQSTNFIVLVCDFEQGLNSMIKIINFFFFLFCNMGGNLVAFKWLLKHLVINS